MSAVFTPSPHSLSQPRAIWPLPSRPGPLLLPRVLSAGCAFTPSCAALCAARPSLLETLSSASRT